MKRVLLVSLLFASLGATGLSHAQVPETMSYQGVLTDGAGTIVPDGPYNLTFTLYDAPTDGTALWTETQAGVPVSGGVFSVRLGTVNPLTLAFATPMYFGIAVGADPELAPRIALASSPYALSLRLPFAGSAPSGVTPSLSIANTLGGAAIVANPLLQVEGAASTIQLYGDAAGDASVVLPGNAISSSEVLDEPGVASATSDGVTGVSSTSFVTLLSRTIDVPADGYVLALGTCDFTFFHSLGTVDNYAFGVSASPSSLPANQDVNHSIGSTFPTDLYTLPMTSHGLFQVSAGSRTFYFLVHRTSGGGMTILNKQFTLAYFPTAYGPVTPTGAQAAAVAPAANAGLTSADIAAEQREAAAFSAERMQHELAALRARLESLEARSRAGAKAVRK